MIGIECACLAAQLKILACNVSGGELQGTILVNGQLVHPKEFRNQSAVVWQSDVLLSSSTVRALPCMPLTLQHNMQQANLHHHRSPHHRPIATTLCAERSFLQVPIALGVIECTACAGAAPLPGCTR